MVYLEFHGMLPVKKEYRKHKLVEREALLEKIRASYVEEGTEAWVNYEIWHGKPVLHVSGSVEEIRASYAEQAVYEAIANLEEYVEEGAFVKCHISNGPYFRYGIRNGVWHYESGNLIYDDTDERKSHFAIVRSGTTIYLTESELAEAARAYIEENE